MCCITGLWDWDVSMKNPVAKHARTFNTACVQVDRKKALKRGKTKHKGIKYAHKILSILCVYLTHRGLMKKCNST